MIVHKIPSGKIIQRLTGKAQHRQENPTDSQKSTPTTKMLPEYREMRTSPRIPDVERE
jgi:hypothetical protein